MPPHRSGLLSGLIDGVVIGRVEIIPVVWFGLPRPHGLVRAAVLPVEARQGKRNAKRTCGGSVQPAEFRSIKTSVRTYYSQLVSNCSLLATMNAPVFVNFKIIFPLGLFPQLLVYSHVLQSARVR